MGMMFLLMITAPFFITILFAGGFPGGSLFTFTAFIYIGFTIPYSGTVLSTGFLFSKASGTVTASIHFGASATVVIAIWFNGIFIQRTAIHEI